MTKVRFQSAETPVLLIGRLSISSERAPKDLQAWELFFVLANQVVRKVQEHPNLQMQLQAHT